MMTLQRIVLIAGALALAACTVPEQAMRLDPVPTTTGSATELVRVTNDPMPEFWPRPSPDAKSVLFTTVDSSSSESPRSSIVRIDLGSPGRNLVSGFGSDCPVWHPDGRSFVYALRNDLGTESRLVRTSFGGSRSGITFVSNAMLGGWDDQPDISPDGQRIAFHTLMNAQWQIGTVEFTGSNFTIYCAGNNPRFSPDGKRLVFTRVLGSSSHIFTIDIAGGGQITQLTTTGQNLFPCWSPDGKWIAFTAARNGFHHLFYMSADGSNLTQLTQGHTNEMMPSWSSDGFIYFVSNAGDNEDIWRLKPVVGR